MNFSITSNSQIKIIFFHTGASSFSNKDSQIFNSIGTLNEFCFSSSSKSMIPIVFIKQFWFLLTRLFSAKIYIAQFAGYHSFLPGIFAKLTGRPLLIISGGTDCVCFPAIRYGNFYKSGLGLFTKWSYQLATHLAPKHYSLYDYDFRYDSSIPLKQGIKNFVKGINKPVTVITNGYDDTKFYRSSEKIKNSFITVSGSFEYPFQVALKGIDLILQAAERFPECSFTIVGVPEWKKLDVRSNNVTLLPPQKNTDLPALYSKHQFYLQLSMAEGFPNALCEAMLCECVPIVSNVFSMPEIIGNSGFVLEHRKIDELIPLLNKSINDLDLNNKSILARNLISQNYPIKLREEKLTELINQLIAK